MLRLIVSLAVLVPIGFASRRVNNGLGGLFYVTFWILFFALRFRRTPARTLAAAVLAGTCTLEFLQLWHPPLLEWIRGYWVGRTLIGTTFDWYDFPYYFAGAAVGWAWLHMLRTK